MEKVITTALLVIASIVAAVALINAVLPALGKSSSALATANSEAAKRIKTDIEVIHATGDTAGTITVWVKNVGTQVVRSVKQTDVIITKPTAAGGGETIVLRVRLQQRMLGLSNRRQRAGLEQSGYGQVHTNNHRYQRNLHSIHRRIQRCQRY